MNKILLVLFLLISVSTLAGGGNDSGTGGGHSDIQEIPYPDQEELSIAFTYAHYLIQKLSDQLPAEFVTELTKELKNLEAEKESKILYLPYASAIVYSIKDGYAKSMTYDTVPKKGGKIFIASKSVLKENSLLYLTKILIESSITHILPEDISRMVYAYENPGSGVTENAQFCFQLGRLILRGVMPQDAAKFLEQYYQKQK